jgi:predicted phosphodiesterase
MTKIDKLRKAIEKEGAEGVYKRCGESVQGIALAFNLSNREQIKRTLHQAGFTHSSGRAPRDVLRARRFLDELGLEPDPDLFDYLAADTFRANLHTKLRKLFPLSCKTVVLSDLHIPFVKADLVNRALEQDGCDAQIIVLAGDIVDMYALSSFHKDRAIASDKEITVGEKLLRDLGELPAQIVVIRANHERRMEKMLSKVVMATDPSLWNKLREHLNLIAVWQERLAAPNIHLLNHWWVRIGDAAVCHADEFSSVHGKTATNVADWMVAQNMTKRFGVRAVVQAHSHHQSNLRYRGLYCLETGCLCNDMDYLHSGKLGPGKKEGWHRGYVVLDQYGGVTDPNRTRYVVLE